MRSAWRTINFIATHPLAKRNKSKAFGRFFKWQIGRKINPYPTVFPFVENSTLLVSAGMTGATGNIYTGLHEFNDMGFLLHFLRKSDGFVDIGANVGSYTILASSVVGAKTIAVEPSPSTFVHLINNIHVNQVEALVTPHNIGLGDNPGSTHFTDGLDTVNHMVPSDDTIQPGLIEIEVNTLDNLLQGKDISLMKIDVEGYEKFVLEGGSNTLASSSLQAIIIELNGSGDRYGIDESEIHELLLTNNFNPYSYDPLSRELVSLSTFGLYNTIYIRNIEQVRERVSTARKFTVLGSNI